MSKTVITPRLNAADLREMEKSDNKGVAVHRYSSFYYQFDIVEREKSFEIGKVSILKDHLEPLKLTERYTQQNKHEPIGKLVSLLLNLETLKETDQSRIKEQYHPLLPVAKALVEEFKIQSSSYFSLLNEGLGSIKQTATFNKEKSRDNSMGMSM
ncbi:hypothetical protein RYA05_06085 [Pseudomonas syringae pv. actinidiae]|nr:hypothetical protein [Pseudomonas syringae pv. actinidiae]